MARKLAAAAAGEPKSKKRKVLEAIGSVAGTIAEAEIRRLTGDPLADGFARVLENIIGNEVVSGLTFHEGKRAVGVSLSNLGNDLGRVLDGLTVDHAPTDAQLSILETIKAHLHRSSAFVLAANEQDHKAGPLPVWPEVPRAFPVDPRDVPPAIAADPVVE